MTEESSRESLTRPTDVPLTLLDRPPSLPFRHGTQAKMASQIRSRKQRRFPAAQNVSSERTFVGGGYRVDTSSGCGGGGGGAGGCGAVRGSGRSAGTAPSNSHVGGDGACAGNNLASTRSSSCPALAAAPAGILDLEAITAAAGRLNSCGGGSGGAGLHPENVEHHHPRNRFAPMVESEVERFLMQSWKNDYVVAGIGDDDSVDDGGGRGGLGDSMGCGDGKTAVSSLLSGIGSYPANKQLRVVGTSTRRNEGRPLKAGATSAREVVPSSPRASTLLEGWTTNQAPTTETER